MMQIHSAEWVMGMLGVVSTLIFVWIIMIHLRVNRLKKEIEQLKSIAEKQ